MTNTASEAQYALSSRPKSAVGGRSGGIWPAMRKSFTPLCLALGLMFVSVGCEKKPTESIELTRLLQRAVRDEDIAQVRLHISNGADVNAKNQRGWTSLHFAATGGNKDVAELLIAKGADINAKTEHGQTPLFYAAANGHSDVAELLVDEGADVNAATPDRYTPLHYAAVEGYKNVVELLLAKGANVNVKTDNGNTPLTLAKDSDYKEIVELLLKHGAKE